MSSGTKILSNYDNESGNYFFPCPHCGFFIQVNRSEVNCKIFRHGYYYNKNPDNTINLLSQINPHETKEICEALFKENKIIGCAKPFKMIWDIETQNYYIDKCDYI